jgi:hypothetical protein
MVKKNPLMNPERRWELLGEIKSSVTNWSFLIFTLCV